MKWYKVSEKLPEISTAMEIKKVLVIHWGYIVFGWRTELGWRIENSPSEWEDIEYWMPLPKLPKERE